MKGPQWRFVRDAVLFVAGLALTVNEALYVTEPRAELLVLFAAMMGLPMVLRKDEGGK